MYIDSVAVEALNKLHPDSSAIQLSSYPAIVPPKRA